jgi:hypothetical protein
MQLLLSFAQNPSNQIEQGPNVWLTLQSEQQSETLAVLARLLAKAAATNVIQGSTATRKGKRND